MSTIRFDHQDELDSLIARIYLDTNHKLSKKALLEIIYEIGTQDYERLLKKIQGSDKNDEKELRNKFIERFSGVLSIPDLDEIEITPKSIWEREVE
jgi:hypothetical protein